MLKCGFLLVCSCCYQANWFVIKSVSVVSSLYRYFGVSGVNHLYELSFYYYSAIQSVGFILSTQCSRGYVLLCLPPSVNVRRQITRDLLEVSTQTLYRPVHRVMTRFLLRRICLITTVKNGHCSLITLSQNV